MATLKHVYEKYVNKANTCVLPSYYKAFDYRYAGFIKKRITFIAGRPLSGKSWFLCNVAINIAKHNNKVLFITQNITETAKRMATIAPELPLLNIEEEVLLTSIKLRGLCQKYQPDIVFIDIHLLGNVINKKILRRFKQIAEENNTAIVMTGTLNRAIDTRIDKMPKTKDFCGINEQTGVLETADAIFTFYNPKLYFPPFVLPERDRLIIIPIKAISLQSTNLEIKENGKIVEWEAMQEPLLN